MAYCTQEGQNSMAYCTQEGQNSMAYCTQEGQNSMAYCTQECETVWPTVLRKAKTPLYILHVSCVSCVHGLYALLQTKKKCV